MFSPFCALTATGDIGAVIQDIDFPCHLEVASAVYETLSAGVSHGWTGVAGCLTGRFEPTGAHGFDSGVHRTAALQSRHNGGGGL
jgi:hypothetical protein